MEVFSKVKDARKASLAQLAKGGDPGGLDRVLGDGEKRVAAAAFTSSI